VNTRRLASQEKKIQKDAKEDPLIFHIIHYIKGLVLSYIWWDGYIRKRKNLRK
jgi:hypothetical protein